MDCGVAVVKRIKSKIRTKRLMKAKRVVKPGWRGFRIKRAFGKKRIPSQKRIPKARVKYGRKRITVFRTKQRSPPLVHRELQKNRERVVGESGDEGTPAGGQSSEPSAYHWEENADPSWDQAHREPRAQKSSTSVSSELSDFQGGEFGSRRNSSDEYESGGHDSYNNSKGKFYRHRRKKVLSTVKEEPENPVAQDDDQFWNGLEIDSRRTQSQTVTIASSDPDSDYYQRKLSTDFKSQCLDLPKKPTAIVVVNRKHGRRQNEDASDLTNSKFEGFYNDLIHNRTPSKPMTREQALADLRKYPSKRPEYRPGYGWVKKAFENKKRPGKAIPKKKSPKQIKQKSKPKRSETDLSDLPEPELEKIPEEEEHIENEEVVCVETEEGTCVENEDEVWIENEEAACVENEDGAWTENEEGSCVENVEPDLIPDEVRVQKKRVTFSNHDQIYICKCPDTPPEVKEREKRIQAEIERLRTFRKFYELGDGTNRPPWKDHCAFDEKSCYRKFDLRKPKDWYDKPKYTFELVPDPKQDPDYLDFYERSERTYHQEVRRVAKITQDNLVLLARCRAAKSHYKYSRKTEHDVRTIAINFRNNMKRFYVRSRLRVDFFGYCDRRPFRSMKEEANPLATVLKFVSRNKKKPSRKLLESIIGQVMNTNNIQFTRIQDKCAPTPPPTRVPTSEYDPPLIPPSCKFYPGPLRYRR